MKAAENKIQMLEIIKQALSVTSADQPSRRWVHLAANLVSWGDRQHGALTLAKPRVPWTKKWDAHRNLQAVSNETKLIINTKCELARFYSSPLSQHWRGLPSRWRENRLCPLPAQGEQTVHTVTQVNKIELCDESTEFTVIFYNSGGKTLGLLHRRSLFCKQFAKGEMPIESSAVTPHELQWQIRYKWQRCQQANLFNSWRNCNEILNKRYLQKAQPRRHLKINGN